MNLRKEWSQIIYQFCYVNFVSAILIPSYAVSSTAFADENFNMKNYISALKNKNRDLFDFQEPYFQNAIQETTNQNELNIVQFGYVQWLSEKKRTKDATRILNTLIQKQLQQREKEVAIVLMAHYPGLVDDKTFSNWVDETLKTNKTFYPNVIYPEIFEAYVSSSQSQRAVRFYLSEYSRIEKTQFPVDLEDSKVKLVSLIEKQSDVSENTVLLKMFAENFPLTASSREAVRVLKIKDISQLFLDKTQKERQAKRIFQFFGPTTDARQLAFNILRFDQMEPLDQLEFAVSVRDYEKAQAIIENLKNKVTEASFPQLDRYLFFYARTMSSLQKTELAAEAYKRIADEFPQSKFYKQARTRRAKALHITKRYAEAASEFQYLASHRGFGKATDFKYQSFWSYYLGGDYMHANSVGQNFLKVRGVSSEMQTSIRYWLARIHEKQGDLARAKASYKLLLSQKSDFNLYKLFAQWRLSITEPSFKRVNLKQRIEAKTLNHDSQVDLDNLPPSLARAFQYWDAGLMLFARDEIRSNWNEFRNLKNIEDLLLLCYDLKMYDLSERVSTNRVSDKTRYPIPYDEMLKEAEKTVRIKSTFVSAIMRAESRLNPFAISWVGARGLMQLIPITATKIAETNAWQQFRLEDLSAPETNVGMGSWYLSKLMSHYQNNIVLAVAAYNAGPVAVDRWVSQRPNLAIDEFAEEIPFGETKTYVGRVLANLDRYEDIHFSKNLNLENYLANGTLPKISDDWAPF